MPTHTTAMLADLANVKTRFLQQHELKFEIWACSFISQSKVSVAYVLTNGQSKYVESV